MRTTSAPEWKASPWPYFILALGWSWLFWIPVGLTGMDISVTPGIALFTIGIFGPAVSAILLTYLTGDKQERREYWNRLISFKRIGPRWYAIIILIAPVYSVLAILSGLVIKGTIPAFDIAVRYMTHPLTIIMFAIQRMVYGPLLEELGMAWIRLRPSTKKMERISLQSRLRGDLGSLAHADVLHAWLIDVGDIPAVVNAVPW